MEAAISVDTETASEFDVVANEYGFYCMPRAYQHREISQTIMSGGVYEPATLRFLRRQLEQGDIVTGGAFIGDFFPALVESLAPGALLHTFEPNPTSHAACEETIRLNGLHQVKLHQVAVGETEDELILQTSRSGKSIAAGEKIVTDMTEDDARGIPVRVTTIDQIVPRDREVSVLHLDVEGFEAQALKGARRIITDHHPLIVLEAERRWKWDFLREVINGVCGGPIYSMAGIMENNAIFRRN